MKNKTLQRVLSFCLALLLCFTWNIAEPLVANAFAIELSWVTYALISFLAASGFTFAVAGGIDALQAEVEEKVDQYYAVTGIDLYQLIAQTLRFNNNNNGQPGFWFTMAALAAIGEFMDWLKSDQLWEPGEEIASVMQIATWDAVMNGESVVAKSCVVAFDSYGTVEGYEDYKRYKILDYGTLVPKNSNRSIGKDSYYSVRESDGYITYFTLNSTYTVWMWYYYSTSETATSNIHITDSGHSRSAFGLMFDDVLGLTFAVIDGQLYFGHYDANGYFYPIRIYDRSITPVFVNEGYTITVPETITEFEVDQDKVFEISFDCFEGEFPFSQPDELADCVREELEITGTFPSVKTEVVTENQPSPLPTPVPTPEPTPVVSVPDFPNYPDIGELGLPDLGNMILFRFPFSLPYSFGMLISTFTAERQTPKWEVTLPKPLNTTFTIDLSDYEELGTISRWSTTIGYCFFLILATKKFINW